MNIRILYRFEKIFKKSKKSKGRNNRISCFSVDLHLKKSQQLTESQNMLVNFVLKLILKQ
jgi:hypothetical protein